CLVVDSKIKGSNGGCKWKIYITDERGDVKSKLVKISLNKTKPTDTIEIDYTGVTPDTFKTGGIAIVEGTYTKAGIFKADTLVAKCPSKYVGKDTKVKTKPKSKNI
ncbi:MAG TPA: cytochrome c maturation protein CcmE, partial [Actinobacteria bacterium]|nr:cytochrome c maturation protein CcmE [Actinomycetes bacterium]HEX21557.1 cytochrome c maturation protein CcmE [Actinomycetota bacterium]